MKSVIENIFRMKEIANIKQIFYLLFITFLSSCVSLRPNLKVSQLSYCAPSTSYSYDTGYIPLPNILPLINKDSLLLKTFSYQDLLLANASGSFFLLRDLVHLRENIADDDDSLNFLVKKQQIFNRLLLASIEVASLAAELDCESERSKQLATYLDQINDTRIQRLTILSVVTGALTAIGTSVIKDNSAQITVGIGGSIISAVFGGLAAISSKHCIEFKHKRNLLSDIWFDKRTSASYPPFIWFVLNNKELNNGITNSIQTLKDRWITEGLLDITKNTKQIDLFFGTGGKYQADDLHTRTSMLNQLKAEIRSINQNLQSLMLKLYI